MKKQKQVITASFIYFVALIDKNGGKIPPYLKKAYSKVKFIVQGNLEGNISDKAMSQVLDTQRRINEIIKDVNYDIDMLLTSVTILAEYYDQLRGKKKHYYPMSLKEILELQDELLEDCEHIDSTFEYCEFLVKELLS